MSEKKSPLEVMLRTILAYWILTEDPKAFELLQMYNEVINKFGELFEIMSKKED